MKELSQLAKDVLEVIETDGGTLNAAVRTILIKNYLKQTQKNIKILTEFAEDRQEEMDAEKEMAEEDALRNMRERGDHLLPPDQL